jgi:hypothetical protein
MSANGFPVGGQRVKDPEWTALMFRVDETGIIDEKELASSKAIQSPAPYRQEWLCDFSAASDNVLIGIDLVSEACQRVALDAYVTGSPKILGVDVARFGDDRSVMRSPMTSPASERIQSFRVEAKTSHDMDTDPRQYQIFARRR